MQFLKIGLPVIVVLAGVGGGTYLYANRDQAPDYSTTIVTRGDMSVSINGSGNLALSNTKNITYSTAAKVASVLVVEGQTVNKDQPLLTLDTSYFQTQLKTLNDSLLQSQKSLIQAQINVQNAQNSLDKIKVPYSADQIAAAYDNVLIDQATVQTDQTNLALAISKSETANIQKWSAQLDKDQRTLNADSTIYQNMLTATPDPQQLSLAQLNLQLSQSALVDAQNNVTTAQTAVDTAKAPPSTLYAPFTGVVSTVNAVAGNSYKTNDTAMIMVNTGIITVNIQVSEANIFKIKTGQDASVTVSSTGMAYPAKITFISSNATTSQGVVSYRVTVTLTQSGDSPGSQGGGTQASLSQLKAGLTTIVGIVVAQSKNTLLLSNSAITTINGVNTVQVLGTDGKITTKTVTTGIGDVTNTEIVSGLLEGEVVIIPQAPGSTTSSKAPATTSGGGILQPTPTSGAIPTIIFPTGGGGGFTPPVVTR